jgi:2,3-bisphosphoglycerate-dependent phosphoglycerate mutase
MPRALLDAERLRRVDEPWPQGESWRGAVARVTECLVELPRRYAGKRLLVIGHVATRWALDHHGNGVSLEQLVAEDFAWQEGWEYRLTG